MMRMKALFAASLGTLIGSAAIADHPFIMPSASNVTGLLGTVTIDAASSDAIFQFDHRPIQLGQIKVWKPDGTLLPTPDGTTSRFRSSFDLKLDTAGTWKIGVVNVMVGGTAMVDGVERRITTMRMGGRPIGPGGPGGGPNMGGPQGGSGGPGSPGGPPRQPPIQLAELPASATDLKLTEMVGRTEAFVTAGEPTTTVFGGETRGITLQPITHPTDLVSNEPAKFRFLIDGRPAAALKVALIADGQRFRNSEAATDLVTDGKGEVTIKWPAAGYYLMTATTEDAKVEEKRATARRLTYAVTLEVAAP